jgi:hypothetical protein
MIVHIIVHLVWKKLYNGYEQMGVSRMTIEELKAEFAKYLADSIDYYSTEEPLTDRKLLQIWLDCAEPREKKILELQKENKQLKQQIDKLKEEKQYETCPYRSTDMGCDYCDYRDRELKDEVEE